MSGVCVCPSAIIHLLTFARKRDIAFIRMHYAYVSPYRTAPHRIAPSELKATAKTVAKGVVGRSVQSSEGRAEEGSCACQDPSE